MRFIFQKGIRNWIHKIGNKKDNPLFWEEEEKEKGAAAAESRARKCLNTHDKLLT